METKKCPRCAKEFTCNSKDITNCQCYGIAVSEDTQQYLKKTNYNCLCNTCLLTLNDIHAQIKAENNQDSLTEELDYYQENGLVVFTEYYHIKKGYCCNNHCRHCPYGKKPN